MLQSSMNVLNLNLFELDLFWEKNTKNSNCVNFDQFEKNMDTTVSLILGILLIFWGSAHERQVE